MKPLIALWAVTAISSAAYARADIHLARVIDMGLGTSDGTVITDKDEEKAYLESYRPPPEPPQFLPQIIGKPKATVDRVLGKPDEPCVENLYRLGAEKFQGLECRYHAGKVEIVYFNKRADWIALNEPENSDFNALTLWKMKALCALDKRPDLLSDDGFRWWRPCDGVISVSMWPGEPGPGDYKVVKRIEIKTATP
ncbi:hypothetical protein ACUSIJ_20420 [Pseudochelatococcus sp. B33]